MVTSPTNLDYLNAEFVDLHANMNFDTRIGRLSFTPNITITTKYEFPLPEGEPARAGLCPNDI